jgi:hypothetical protein
MKTIGKIIFLKGKSFNAFEHYMFDLDEIIYTKYHTLIYNNELNIIKHMINHELRKKIYEIDL